MMQRRTFFKALSGVAVALAAIYGERFKFGELHLADGHHFPDVTKKVVNLNADVLDDGHGSRGMTANWSEVYDGTTKFFIPLWS